MKQSQLTIFADSKYFKLKGMPQENASCYYHNSTQELYRAEDLFRGSDFYIKYTAAFTSEELNDVIPLACKENGKIFYFDLIISRYKDSYTACLLDAEGEVLSQGEGSTELEAKSWLIRNLLKKKIIKFGGDR